ncbi:MAG: four helix bundle protein [Calditrichaeota bacterium]|nr:MAG: four helix bundle protein [Calditrichota bacterium]MBL1206514.1 four helix bundle protein [Calditrichota bacterium]NOG46342.1 four helix bundle protein [Calditrichota bacterium]
MIYALASNDETIDHLETIFETGSLNDEKLYKSLHEGLEILGKKLNKFLSSVTVQHNQ